MVNLNSLSSSIRMKKCHLIHSNTFLFFSLSLFFNHNWRMKMIDSLLGKLEKFFTMLRFSNSLWLVKGRGPLNSTQLFSLTLKPSSSLWSSPANNQIRTDWLPSWSPCRLQNWLENREEDRWRQKQAEQQKPRQWHVLVRSTRSRGVGGGGGGGVISLFFLLTKGL